MISPERLGAFIEYVARPMAEDIRIILEKAKELNVSLSEKTAKQIAAGLILSHFIGELIRSITYITITWILCQSALKFV